MTQIRGHSTMRLTPELLQQLNAALEKCIFIETAGRLLGIPIARLAVWARKGQRIVVESGDSPIPYDEQPYAELWRIIGRTRAEVIGDAIGTLKAAVGSADSPGDWRAATWLLERMDRERWAAPHDEIRQLQAMYDEVVARLKQVQEAQGQGPKKPPKRVSELPPEEPPKPNAGQTG
jgi:hypothetical protein